MKPITMLAIIALVVAAIVALTVIGFVLHILFSPWLLVVIAIVAWIKFRPSRSRQYPASLSIARGWPGSACQLAFSPRWAAQPTVRRAFAAESQRPECQYDLPWWRT